MRILAMPVWPERLSDEEYVKKTRKGLRFMGHWRYVIVLMVVVIFLLFASLIVQGIHLLRDLTDTDPTTGHGGPAPAKQLVYAIYFVAMMMGGFLGLRLGNLLSHIATLLFACRTNNLLVECWDALSDAERTRPRRRSS